MPASRLESSLYDGGSKWAIPLVVESISLRHRGQAFKTFTTLHKILATFHTLAKQYKQDKRVKEISETNNLKH